MEKRHMFCGIFIDNTQAFASVINQKGKVILCSRYRCDVPEEDFTEIVDHLRHFAEMSVASLSIAFADRGDAPAPWDPLAPLCDEILRVSNNDLAQTNLARSSYGPDGQYNKTRNSSRSCVPSDMPQTMVSRTNRASQDGQPKF